MALPQPGVTRLQHLDAFEGHKAYIVKIFQLAREGAQAADLVHDLNDDRQIVGEAERVGRVDMGRPAEPQHALQGGCAREPRLTGAQHNGLVDEVVALAGFLVGVNPQQSL